MYGFLVYLPRSSWFWKDNGVCFMCSKIEGAFDPRIMIQWCFQLLTLLAIYFVFEKNRSRFIIPKEATPTNNMAPATNNHHGWWQREGLTSIGGEKSPLQSISLVHQMWTNTNLNGCLFLYYSKLIVLHNLSPTCQSRVNAFTPSSMTNKSNIHVLIGETFLHQAHQIWPDNRTSKHIPSNNFSLDVEFIYMAKPNPRGDALLCFQLRSFAHNRWVNCVLFDITITSSCKRLQTCTETPFYILQHLWEQTVASFYLDGNK